MPDRYGEPADEPLALGFDDDFHAIAITVGCRYCNAPIGKPCTNQTLPNHPPTRMPHIVRVNDAEEVPF